MTDNQAKPRWHPKQCLRCPAVASDQVHISARGLCEACSSVAIADAIMSMHTKTGPQWSKWKKRRLVATLREYTPDDSESFKGL